MSHRKKIFISHSTPDDPHRKEYLEQLYSTLKDHGNGNSFKVFLDRKSITCGEDWHEKILSDLCLCDIAIILLSTEALESHWVRQEAAYTAMRRYADPNLQIIVVILEDEVTHEKIANCPYLGGVARLHDVQFAKHCSTPEDILSYLDTSLPSLHSPMGELLIELSEILAEIPSRILQRAIRALNYNCISDLEWNTSPYQTLTAAITNEQNNSLENLTTIIKKIGHKLGKEGSYTLLIKIMHLWITPEAKNSFSDAYHNRKPTVAYGFNLKQLVSESYAQSAWGNGEYKTIYLNTHDREIDQIKETISENIGLRTMKKASLEHHLNTKLKKPLLLVFPPLENELSHPSNDDLKNIMEISPKIAILILRGHYEAYPLPDGISLPAPQNVDSEALYHSEYIETTEYIDCNIGRPEKHCNKGQE